jgi:hypothetical protein
MMSVARLRTPTRACRTRAGLVSRSSGARMDFFRSGGSISHCNASYRLWSAPDDAWR